MQELCGKENILVTVDETTMQAEGSVQALLLGS